MSSLFSVRAKAKPLAKGLAELSRSTPYLIVPLAEAPLFLAEGQLRWAALRQRELLDLSSWNPGKRTLGSDSRGFLSHFQPKSLVAGVVKCLMLECLPLFDKVVVHTTEVAQMDELEEDDPDYRPVPDIRYNDEFEALARRFLRTFVKSHVIALTVSRMVEMAVERYCSPRTYDRLTKDTIKSLQRKHDRHYTAWQAAYHILSTSVFANVSLSVGYIVADVCVGLYDLVRSGDRWDIVVRKLGRTACRSALVQFAAVSTNSLSTCVLTLVAFHSPVAPVFIVNWGTVVASASVSTFVTDPLLSWAEHEAPALFARDRRE